MNRSGSLALSILLSTVLSAAGCSYFSHREQIAALQDVSRSGKELETALTAQARQFSRMKEALQNNTLSTGTSKEKIISEYGEPILTKPPGENKEISEILLYRHPTRFFASDRIYLYFDRSETLTRIEYLPSQ